MKLTIFILTIAIVQASASSFAQRISLSEKNTPISVVLKKIQQQSGYDIFYKNKLIKDSKINLDLKEVSIETALKAVLDHQDLEFSIEDKLITIQLKEKTFLDRLANRWATIDVSGRIVDAEGNGIPGATVSVKGSSKSAITGKNGIFNLSNVNEDAVLVISYIGFIKKEVNASGNLGDVILEQSLSKLDEVQVIAYGTTTQRLSTGNVTTIKADVIEKQPVNNPLLALQGRVPGLFIEQATGFAGTGVKVRIQGQNSISNGNDPLYVIDGIPFTSQLLPGGNSILGGSGLGDGKTYGNPLNFINPADIESIDILKDADATAIYGSRAANGAILITTKKGKQGEIKTDATFKTGFGQVSRKLRLMDSEQYLEMRRETFKNDGILSPAPGTFGDSDLNGNWINTKSKDWQEEMLGGRANYNDIQTSVSGGNANTTFLFGGGYHKEGNIFIGSFADTKASAHLSLSSFSTNQKFKIQLSASYSEDNNTLPVVDLTSFAINLAPVAPNLFNEDNKLNWQSVSGASTFFANPMYYIYTKFKDKANVLISNAIISYQIFKGFEFKSSFGYNKLESSSLNTLNSEGAPPEYRQYYRPSTTFVNNSISTWSIEPQLNYSHALARGKLEILLGSTMQQKTTGGVSTLASGFISELVSEDIKSASSITVNSSINTIYKYNALFGRINYNYKDKYILNFTGRRDGSSRFGSENQFHNFWAIGAAWIFSEEEAIKRNYSFLSFGKLRASFGTTGSDQIDDYRFLSLYSVIPGLTAPYQGINGFRPYKLANPYLQWEETKKMQIGFDLGILKDRIIFNSNYFRNISSNQLNQLPLPGVTGFYAVDANLPTTVLNTGWEFILGATNINHPNFKWTTSINLTLSKNKLLAVDDFENSVLNGIYVIGKSLNIQKLYHFLGVDPATGIYQVQTRDGNPTTSPLDEDQNIVITTDPKYYGGVQNAFEYKNFQLDLLFQFTKQIGMNYIFGNSQPGQFNGGMANQPEWTLDRWQKPGDISKMQKYTNNATTLVYAKYSDAAWSSASYIRLKNISLSWKLPSKLLGQKYLQNCKIFFQGQNMLTFTSYKGLDPETRSSLTLPPLRVITMGIQINL